VSDYRRIAEALFEDRYGQPLLDWVADRKDEGLTWRNVARQLSDLTGGIIDLAPQTLLNWAADHREPAA